MRNRIILTADKFAAQGSASGGCRNESSAIALDRLLVAGGDARLALHPDNGVNAYGCAPSPCPATLTFSSTTASTISTRAYRAVEEMHADLQAGRDGIIDRFDAGMDRLRRELRDCLGLRDIGAEIVFSPSGTDSQLHALFFAKLALGNPLTTVVVGADQTGSGTAFTSRGCNFADRTAKGEAVEKGSSISGLADGTNSIDIGLCAEQGGRRTDREIDASVLEAVAGEIAKGRRVALQIMDASKLGWRAPSDGCLQEIGERWPGSVLVVVDACQMRLSRHRIRDYLDRDYIVLITGSKFFTGPAFSGATLLPASLANRIEAMDIMPSGLAHYACAADIPQNWTRLRARIQGAPNVGQLLRWAAALEEIRSYYALPPDYRHAAMQELSKAIANLIIQMPALELLSGQVPHSDGIDDEEMATRSVFAFLIRRGNRHLDYDDCQQIYRALNQDLSAALSKSASAREQALAASLCHIGQPVGMMHGGQPVAVLRISIGARHIVDAWSKDPHSCRLALEAVIADAARTIAKLSWLVEDYSPVRAGQLAIQET